MKDSKQMGKGFNFIINKDDDENEVYLSSIFLGISDAEWRHYINGNDPLPKELEERNEKITDVLQELAKSTDFNKVSSIQ